MFLKVGVEIELNLKLKISNPGKAQGVNSLPKAAIWTQALLRLSPR